MRLAVKTSLALAAGFCAVLLALALAVQMRLRAFEDEVLRRTARLIGHEIAAAISEPSLVRILRADRPARTHLRRMLDGLLEESDLVTSITVVNDNGTVVASDALDVGGSLATPPEMFGDAPRVRYFRSGDELLDSDAYTVVVPLQRREHLAGYLALTLDSARIAREYRDSHRELLLAALGGLLVAATVGFMLQAQLYRRGRALAREIEAVVAGGRPQPPPRRVDEFSEALETAGRLGGALVEARQEHTKVRRRLGALTESLDVGVLLLDAEGALEFASPRACAMFGREGFSRLEAHWPEARSALATPLARLQSGATAVSHGDVEVATPAGTRRLRLELFPIGEPGMEGVLALARDRGVVEALETDLRLATQLRGFAHIYMAVAHELRAPLGAMFANLDQLDDALAADDAGVDPAARERQRACISVLRGELRRLDQSLFTLLTETAPPSEKQEVFDLRVLLLDLERLLAPQARRQKVELSLEIPDRAVRLRAHRDRFKQALLNVVINGLEVMPDGGRLDLRLVADARGARCEIRDTGPGIPVERLAKIFEMHYTTKATGTGVGLYVARSVFEAAGGAIRVDSALGHGTCFEITLPGPLEEG